MRRLAAWTLVLGVWAAGCGPKHRSSFLGPDVSGFEKQSAHVWVWKKPGVDLGRYPKLMVDPLVITYVEKPHHQGIHRDEQRRLGAHVRTAAARALAQYQPARHPLPDTLHMRIAVSQRIEPKDHALQKTVTAETATLEQMAQRVTQGSRLMHGPVVIETEFRDAASGERLLATVYHLRVGSAAHATWAQVDRALAPWANHLKQTVFSMSLP